MPGLQSTKDAWQLERKTQHACEGVRARRAQLASESIRET